MTNRPNVLLLTVDSIRADRLSAYGHDRPTTPNIERLAEQSLFCADAVALGPFTQVACIQLFTSSRPLSYGGYDRGAAGRPDTLFKRFRDAGYRTWGLSTIHWVSPYYGYTDGLEDEHLVFLLNTLVGMAVNNMRDTLLVYRAGGMDADRMLSIARPVIHKLFDNVEHYAAMMRDRGAEYARDFPDAKFVCDGYDFKRVADIARKHRAAFDADELGYIDTHLGGTPGAHEWLGKEWHLCRTPGKLISEAAFQVGNRLLAKLNPSLALLRGNRFRMSADAHAISARVCRALEDAQSRQASDDDRPFFIWAHYKDNHQPFVGGPGRQWYRHAPRYLKELGYPEDIDPSFVFRGRGKTDERWEALKALYDVSLRSTDEAIGGILRRVDELGLADNTIVGFCGDHGEEIGDHGDYGHLTLHWEHNVRIPMMFRAPGAAAQRIDNHVCSLDWSPTLADLAGIDPADGWEGAPVASDTVAARDHILMENFCRGNCDFPHRPVYMSVRSKDHKFMWYEYRDQTHKYGPDGPYLFDLKADPGEKNNVYDPSHPDVARAAALIQARLSEIPEVGPERAVSHLPAEPVADRA